jgi:hypothetical protein
VNASRTTWPRLFALAAGASLLLAVRVHAAEPTTSAPPTAASSDPEEQLDDDLKGFGYLTGLARGCVVPEQHAALEREALDLSGAIARLFGTDRAFLFAASFGYGTSVVIETAQCKEVIARYDARVARFRAARGQPK